MKKNYLVLLASLLFFVEEVRTQTTYTSAVSDITLQCSGGTGNRTGVAYNPCFNLYYSVNAGNGSYPIETFGPSGGSSLNSTSQTSDYRGLWWNNVNNRLEGNVYNSGGVYSNTLNTNGYAQSSTSFISSATMPNAQSNGHANIAGNIIYYYNSGTLYSYSKSTNTLISSTSISGLPVATSNLNSYGVVYTGYPGSDVAVYNYTSRIIYFLNSSTAAYSGSCALPSTAPAPSSFGMGFANNRFFLFNSSTSQWIGYPIGNGPSGPAPTASVTANTTLVCNSNPVTLTASGASSYTWSFGGNGTTAIVNPTANTVYSVTATSAAGCVGTNTIAINIIPGPVVSVASTPTSLCTGGTATLTSGGGVNSYTWSNSSNAQSITVTPGSTTTYSVQGTNSVGCISTAVITLTVSGNVPVLSVVSSTPQTCLGKTATLTASGALNYSWTNGVINGVSFNPSVTTTYTVTGQNGCGTSTAVTTISVSPLPVSLISSPTVVCASETATLFASSAATSYSWYPISVNANSIIVSPSVTSVYTVAVSDGTCSGNATVMVTANPNPTITSTCSSSLICAGQVATLTASGGLTYNWTPGNLTAATITVSPTSPTAYSVSGNNSFGCFAGSSQVVIVTPSPTVSVNVSDVLICNGGSSTLSVSGNASGYLWDNGSTNTLITVSPTVSTTYTVIGNSTVGCNATNTVEVDVFNPTITVSGTTTVCDGATAYLQANGGSSYTWNPGGNPFQNINVIPTTSMVYTVTALASSVNISCSASNTLQVTVNPNPTVTASGTRSVICRNESTTLSASGATNYNWSANSSTVVIASTPTVLATSSLVTTLNYSVTGSYSTGCKSTVQVQIKVNGCNGIDEIAKGSLLDIYPNPNNGNFVISINEPAKIVIINSLGQIIQQLELSADNNFTASISQLSAGAYIISAQLNNQSFNKKVIIQN